MLSERRKYHARILGFKYSKFEYLCVKPNRATRANQSPILFYSFIHSAAYEKSLEVFVAREWNRLVPDKREIDSLNKFKIQMKALLVATIPKNVLNGP